TGEKPVASVAALTKRLASLKQEIKGTILDTPKTAAKLSQIAKVLSGKFGAVGRDVRQAILDMFGEITGALGGGGKTSNLTSGGQIATKKLVEGLGLSDKQIREIRQRAAKLTGAAQIRSHRGQPFNAAALADSRSAGRGGINIFINGDIIARDPEDFVKQVQKRARRSSGTRRGTRPGKNRGMG